MSLARDHSPLAHRFPDELKIRKSKEFAEFHEEPIPQTQTQCRGAWKRKVRLGCSECKSGQHKCNEQKPACSRCLGRGLRCVYSTQLSERRFAGMLRKQLDSITVADHPGAVASALRTSTTSVDPKYGAYFDHFRYHVTTQFGGNAFSNFWQHCVLRESARDGCILNAILALGGLDRARKSDPQAAATPLFVARPSPTDSLRRGAHLDHYPHAVSLYARALSEHRRRVATEAIPPRTTLITTLLLVAFEHLHGNMEAVDNLTSRALVMLGREVALPGHIPVSMDRSTKAKHGLVVGLDDDGVRIAAELLSRMVSLNALYTSLYPQCSALIRDSLSRSRSRQSRPEMPPLDANSSLCEIQKAWTSFLTIIGTWIQDANRAGKRCVLEKLPHDNEMLAEQVHYQSQLENLINLIRERFRCSSYSTHELHHGLDLSFSGQLWGSSPRLDDSSWFTLERIQIAVETAYMTVCAALDPTARVWGTFSNRIHDLLDRISVILDALNPEARESGVLYDDMLGVTAHLATESRDWEVRRKAMARWARMLSARSSWENKNCFMGVTALIMVEEAGRLSTAHSVPRGKTGAAVSKQDSLNGGSREREYGTIPVEAQYTWTSGVWDQDYARFTVSLKPKLGAGIQDGSAHLTPTAKDTNVVLDLQDFHFGRSDIRGVDAAELLRRYLAG